MRRTICTSVPLRASARVSSAFTLSRHSSPSFGSQHPRLRPPSRRKTAADGALVNEVPSLAFAPRPGFRYPRTRATAGLLGPCFKTGRYTPLSRRTCARCCRHRCRPPEYSASLPPFSRPFDSLFRVLFIFPSRYLFAIGLSPLFSLRWSIPPFALHSQATRLPERALH